MLTTRYRVMMVAAVLLAVLAIVPGVFAQEETFGLSEEDFAFWGEVNDASTQFTSLDYSFIADVAITAEGETITATLTGVGVLDAATGAIEMDIDGNIDGLGPVDISVRFVDEALYVTGVDDSGVWYEISDADVAALQEQFGDQLPIDPDALASGDAEALGLDEEAQMEVFNAGFGLVEALPGYVEVTREADEDGFAVFFAEFLLEDFVADPNLETLVAVAISSDGAMSFDEAQAAAAEGISAAQMFLTGSELSFTQYIDLATNLVDEGVLGIFVGGEGMPAGVDLEFSVVIDGYNTEVSVETPTDIVPLSEVLAAFMSG